MSTFQRSINRSAALAAIITMLGGIAPGGTMSARAQALPPAAELVARYQEAVGGVDALAGHTSMHSTGEFSVPGAGLTAQFEAWTSRPNLSAMRLEMPGFGEIRSGYNGEVAWSLNPMEGPRLMKDAELLQAADQSNFNAQLRIEGNIASMTTVERTTLGGIDCYKVRVEWKSGRVSHDCYSPDTGLMVGTIDTQVSNMGTAEAITLYTDYKPFGALIMPTRITVQMMGAVQVININGVVFDAVPDSVYALPPEIQTLVAK